MLITQAIRFSSNFARYKNHNPKQTIEEIQVGVILDRFAQLGNFSQVHRVEGRAQSKNKNTPNPDYSFINDREKEVLTADLYEPMTGNPSSIASSLLKKSGQANVGVIGLGKGRSASITEEESAQIAQEILTTPGHTIYWVMVIWQDKLKSFFRK